LLTIICVVQSQSICDKYSTALSLNNSALVTTVVTGTVGQLLNASNGLKIYFDGTKPAGSVDFTASANSAKYNTLASHLVEFFGSALGCTDKSIANYSGNPNMAAVHQSMGINQAETLKFNELLIGVMRGAGVTEPDLKTVAGVLHATRNDICNKTNPDCSTFCFNYSLGGVLTNKQLMTAVVSGSVAVALNSTLKKFFDGTFPAGSVDFTASANSAKFTTLSNHLVEFFGSALGCKDTTIIAYTGNSDMKAVHASMNISAAEFDAFNNAVVSVAAGLGVTTTDQAFLKSVLETTRSAIVAGSSTSSTKPTTGPTTGPTSTTPAPTGPTPAPSTTGFGMILVVPLFSLVSMLLF
jgi:truncated hemoglobin YjbI